MNNLQWYLLTGAAVVCGYYYRRKLVHRLIGCTSWCINTYVDLKWKYFSQPELSTPLHVDTNTRCPVIKTTKDYVTYTYCDNIYISKQALPPTYNEIDQFYDVDECIDDIKCYTHDCNKPIKLLDWEEKMLFDAVSKFAGPLYDFHGSTVHVHEITRVCPKALESPESPITKMVINTANYTEHILLEPIGIY